MSPQVTAPVLAKQRLPVAAVNRWAGSAALALVGLLFVLPFVVPIHRYPLTTFDSEWICAVTLALASMVTPLAGRARVDLAWPLPVIAMGLLGVAFVQSLLGMLHYRYALSSLFIYLTAFAVAYILARWIVAANQRARALDALFAALLAGGVVSAGVQWLQAFDVHTFPDWLVFPMLERISSRRPSANLAQPNLLATYLCWAAIAALYRARSRRVSVPLLACFALFFCGLALTGSRMGSVFGLLLLVLAVTRNALAPVRSCKRALVAAALILGYASGLLMTRLLLVDATGSMATVFGRYAEGSLGQRLTMWSDAVRIAYAHPLLGTGVGEYGGAQYRMAHAVPDLLATNNPHNLALHLAAEFGLPAALAVLAIGGVWAWERRALLRRDAGSVATMACIGLLLLHSLLEYPLWHLHFLVALAVLVGLTEGEHTRLGVWRIEAHRVLAPVGVAVLLAAAVMKVDFNAVAAVWDDYLRERFENREHRPETVARVLVTKDLTYFKPQMDRLYVDVLPVVVMRSPEDIAICERVLTHLADPLVIERCIELLLQAGRIEETYPHIDRLKIFAGSDYPIFREKIEEAIAADGEILDPVRRRLAGP